MSKVTETEVGGRFIIRTTNFGMGSGVGNGDGRSAYTTQYTEVGGFCGEVPFWTDTAAEAESVHAKMVERAQVASETGEVTITSLRILTRAASEALNAALVAHVGVKAAHAAHQAAKTAEVEFHYGESMRRRREDELRKKE